MYSSTITLLVVILTHVVQLATRTILTTHGCCYCFFDSL